MPTPANRLDVTIDALLAGEPTRGSRLAETAALLHASLPPVPPSLAFENRLHHRLHGRAPRAWLQLTPTRLIAAGAVSSAAVGVTALAVWRTTRRQPAGRTWRSSRSR